MHTKESIASMGPDPGMEATYFLAWLKKRRGLVDLRKCNIKWDKEGLDIIKITKKLGEDLLCIQLIRGEKFVRLINWVWADKWMMLYDIEVPHHGQTMRQKNKFQ
jgi:hypothetical protein